MHAQYSRASSIKRSNFLGRHCGSLFPSFFSTIHTFVSRLKSANSEEQKISHLINNLDVLESLPLDGVGMVLPHVLACICRSEAYIRDLKKHSKETSKRKSQQLLISKYPKIVDTLSSRLGVPGTDVHIVPAVMKCIEGLHCSSTLINVLQGGLLNVLVKRGSARCFLRTVLPQLITLMIAGSLQSLLNNRRQSIYQSGSAPLWASMEQETFELTEWLIHTVSKTDIQNVQDAATFAISSLALKEAMGPALCLRFVLPAILCLVCNPSLAVTGYYTEPLAAEYHKHETDNTEETFRNMYSSGDSGDMAAVPIVGDASDSDNEVDEENDVATTLKISKNIELKNDAIDALSTYDATHMYAVRALEGICLHSGVSATIDLVLPHLLQDVFPKLERLYDASSRKSSAALNACILELVSTICGILHLLSPTVVVNSFFVKQKSTGFCLINMLVDIPMPPCEVLYQRGKSSDSTSGPTSELAAAVNIEEVVVAIDNEDGVGDRFDELLHFFRSYRAFLELCKLITTLASHVGRDMALEYVVPVVNKFFGNFVSAFSGLPVMSLAMSHAFNIAVQLFIPLVQLIGPEAFSTSVYNLNPRLEVWLHSLAFEKVSRSPPLPSNILPEAVTESEKKTETREGRLSRFLQWMTPSTEKEQHSGSAHGTPGGLMNQPSSRPGKKSFINDGGTPVNTRQMSGDLDIKYNDSAIVGSEVRLNSTDSVVSAAIASSASGDNTLDLTDESGPVLGISSKLQVHKGESSYSGTPTWTPKKSFGNGKRGSNIYQVFSDQVTAGGNYAHMAGVEPTDYDSAWLLTGTHRWRIVAEEANLSMAGKTRSDRQGSDAHSVKKNTKKTGSISSGAEAIAVNLNAGLSNSRRPNAPAAQLSMTAPKITVDTASEAGSLFSLAMISKVQFHPDDAGVPVKLMVANNVESLLLTGHRNGRVKVFNLNSHPLSSEAVYKGHYSSQASDTGKHKDDKNQLSGGVFCGGFLRDSSHAFTCDGSIRVWDIETQRTIADYSAPAFSDANNNSSFSFCSGISPQECVLPDIGPHGDDLLMATMGSTLSLFDVRLRMKNTLSAVADWRLPIPSLTGNSGGSSSSAAESPVR